MSKKVETLAVFNRVVAKVVEGLKDGDVLPLVHFAGVCERAKVRHSDIGSGLVMLGDFATSPLSGDGVKTKLYKTALLPLDIGDKIAKKLRKDGGPVKFGVEISVKKSALLTVGYSFQLNWTTAPEVLGQMDIINQLLEKSSEAAPETAAA